MRDGQVPGMEENPVDGERGVLPRGIECVADKRVPDVAKVDTNLVGPARKKVTFDQ